MRSSAAGRVLLGALLVDSLANGLFLPLSLVYFVALTGIRLALLGGLLSLATAVTLPVPLWAGALVDRYGPRPVVVCAQLLQAAGFCWYGSVHRPIEILGAATVVATGVRLFWSSIFALVADFADGSGRARSKDAWYALTNMTRTAGLALGGVVTGAVVAAGSATAYRVVGYAAAGCFVIAALLIATAVPVDRAVHEQPAGGYRALLRDRPFVALIGLNTVWALSSMMLATALPTVVLRGISGPSWLAAAVLVVTTVLITAGSAAVARLLAGRRRTRMLMMAGALWAVWALSLTALTPDLAWSVPLIAVGTVLYTVADVVHAPLSAALATMTAPAADRGRYLATFQYSWVLASIVAPTFFTGLWTAGHALPWVALAVLDLASVAGLFALEARLPAAAVRDAPRSGPLEPVS